MTYLKTLISLICTSLMILTHVTDVFALALPAQVGDVVTTTSIGVPGTVRKIEEEDEGEDEDDVVGVREGRGRKVGAIREPFDQNNYRDIKSHPGDNFDGSGVRLTEKQRAAFEIEYLKKFKTRVELDRQTPGAGGFKDHYFIADMHGYAYETMMLIMHIFDLDDESVTVKFVDPQTREEQDITLYDYYIKHIDQKVYKVAKQDPNPHIQKKEVKPSELILMYFEARSQRLFGHSNFRKADYWDEENNCVQENKMDDFKILVHHVYPDISIKSFSYRVKSIIG